MFDKNNFAQILKEINETYNSQRDFAKRSGINRTYLSQYMNMKLDKPPKPEILSKLAKASNDITDYENLMLICGYIDKNMETTEIFKKIFNKYLPLLKKLNLSNELLNLIYKMTVENKPTEYSNEFNLLVSKLPKEKQDNIYGIYSKILAETNEIMESMINNIKLSTKYYTNNYEKDDLEFRFAYHKEAEGLTDEEIADALRFYKEMKNKLNKDKK